MSVEEVASELREAYARRASASAPWLRCPVEVSAGPEAMAHLRAHLPMPYLQRRGIRVQAHPEPGHLQVRARAGVELPERFEQMSQAVDTPALARRFEDGAPRRRQILTERGLEEDLARLLPPDDSPRHRQAMQAWALARLAQQHADRLSLAEFEALVAPARAGWGAR